MAIQIDTAELAGVVAEGVFYGIFLTLFIVAGYVFAGRKSRHAATLNLPMTITAVLMILLATAQLTVDTANVFVAFLDNDRAGRLAFLFDVSTSLFSAKHCVTICQLLVGDAFVSYRCWVVWGKNIYVVILPILLSMGSAVSGSYIMWVFAHVPGVTVKEKSGWVAAIFTLSLAANAVATSLLAFKIWSVGRRTARAMGDRGSSLMPIVRILIESGALNAAYLLVYSASVINGTQALEFMAEIASPISGIIFSIVIIRVGLNAEGELDWTVDHRSTMKFNPRKKPNTMTTTLDPVDITVDYPVGRDTESGLEMSGMSNETKTNGI